MTQYPKRLIEVDLPIARISEHARREKGSRQGHISSLHIWWARRPLAACRAVALASLLPDPADPLCPERFIDEARSRLARFRRERGGRARNLAHAEELRAALLDFVAEFADWENSQSVDFIALSHALVSVAHESLGGEAGSRPLVIDPFAGGGAIPLEAKRIGADSFAGDLNPVAVLLNKVALEYAPRFGADLASDFRQAAREIHRAVKRELETSYPRDSEGGQPVTYLWARTIRCEGPGCGGVIPVTRSLWIDRSRSSTFAMTLTPTKSRSGVDVTVSRNPRASAVGAATARRGSVTCPLCGYTTPRKRVEHQATSAGLGHQLMAVAIERNGARLYRNATTLDTAPVEAAQEVLKRPEYESLIPDEPLPYLRSIFNVHVYGHRTWASLFSPRQLLYLATLCRHVRDYRLSEHSRAPEYELALRTLLGLLVDKAAMLNCNVARWRGDKGRMEGAFALQALPMVWDWAELNPFNESVMTFDSLAEAIASTVDRIARTISTPGTVQRVSATELPLPDDSAALLFTDPPYYDSIPYANLSDFFFVWLKRSIGRDHPALFGDSEAPKHAEIVQLAERNPLYAHKTKQFFEAQMGNALRRAREVTAPSGIGCVVFAHKTTDGWEALLGGLVAAGWVVTASWPIDTELTTRFKAIGTASLASSVHLVCRPRENADGTLQITEVGEWRDLLSELPPRMRSWMRRLSAEGIAGADAIFACLGPALEIFSRYDHVEKANGERVALREFLEQVWAAVANEAVAMMFEDADAGGLEPDARLTAVWLWTLGGAHTVTPTESGDAGEDDEMTSPEDDDSGSDASKKSFQLEYDAARKIAQGLGIDLETLPSVVEVSGDVARLRTVSERLRDLFGTTAHGETKPTARRRDTQGTLFGEVSEVSNVAGLPSTRELNELGRSTLDRVHQAMLLFGSGRGEAMRVFVVESGAGDDQRFWRLAQALSALYPTGSHEKRWIDGVLARKKSLGF